LPRTHWLSGLLWTYYYCGGRSLRIRKIVRSPWPASFWRFSTRAFTQQIVLVFTYISYELLSSQADFLFFRLLYSPYLKRSASYGCFDLWICIGELFFVLEISMVDLVSTTAALQQMYLLRCVVCIGVILSAISFFVWRVFSSQCLSYCFLLKVDGFCEIGIGRRWVKADASKGQYEM